MDGGKSGLINYLMNEGWFRTREKKGSIVGNNVQGRGDGGRGRGPPSPYWLLLERRGPIRLSHHPSVPATSVLV